MLHLVFTHAQNRRSHLHFAFIAVFFWLLTIIGASFVPDYRFTAGHHSFPGYGFYAVEQTSNIDMHWLTGNSSLVIPTAKTGWQILEITARIPTQNHQLQINTGHQQIPTFTLTSKAFRQYALLVSLPTNQTSQLWLHLISDHSELINQRYISLGIQSFSLQRLSHWQFPPIDFIAYVLVNVLILSTLCSWRGKSHTDHFWAQVGLACVHIGILWGTIVYWGQIWVQARIISPILSINIVLIVFTLGTLLYYLIKHRTKALTHSTHPHTYRPDIDGIRAIAVLSVVIYHVFPHLLPGGFVGVDMFFVISGYLITQNILHAHAKQKFSLVDFYRRRIRRILPALIVVLIVTSMLAWVSLLPSEFNEIGTHILASVGFYNNIHLYYSLNYFSDIAIQKPLLHLWSLGIEEQFYIVWPFIISLLVRHPQWRARILTGLVMASFFINVIGIKFQPDATFYLLPSRLWQLAIGGVLAHLSLPADHSPVPKHLANMLAIGAGIAIVASIIFYNHQLAYPGWYALMPTLATVFLIAAGSQTWINRTFLAHPALVWIGLISYPLYLWHWPLLSFANFMAELWLTPIARIGIIVISILCATATYIYVERPIRFGRYRQVPAWGILVAFIGVGIYGAIMQAGYIMVFPKQASVNFMESNNALIDLQANNKIICERWLGNDSYRIPIEGSCYAHIPEKPAPRTHIVIGDSHTRAYFAGLMITDPQAAVFGYAGDGCLPLRNVERYNNTSTRAFGCGDPKRLESVLTIVQRATSASQIPTTIYITGRYALINGSGINPNDQTHIRYQSPGATAVLSESAVDDLFRDGLRGTLDALITLPNTQVVFIDQSPEFPFTPLNCLRGNWLVNASAQCVISQTQVEAQFSRYQRIVDRVLADYPTVQRYDPTNALCSAGICNALGPNQSLWYYDHHHLNTIGGAVVAHDLLHYLSMQPK